MCSTNDAVGGGQVGWGHQVTSLYEVVLAVPNKPLGAIRIRHKLPEADASIPRGAQPPAPPAKPAGSPPPVDERSESTEETFAMAAPPAASIDAAAPDLRFAFAVAAFADQMRGGEDAQHWSLDQIAALARTAAGDKDRDELVGLIARARVLRPRSVAALAK